MTDLINALHAGLDLAWVSSAIYATAVAITASTALFARRPSRRRDARATLAVLLRRRNEPGD